MMENNKELIVLRVGDSFTLFNGKYPDSDCARLEMSPEGDLFLIIFLDNLTKTEITTISNAKMEFRSYSDETGYILPMIRFGQYITFDITFDPSLYKDKRNKISTYQKSNLLHIIALDKNIIKTMRIISIPLPLYEKLIIAWERMLKPEHDSNDFIKWYDNNSKYSLDELWERCLFEAEIPTAKTDWDSVIHL